MIPAKRPDGSIAQTLISFVGLGYNYCNWVLQNFTVSPKTYLKQFVTEYSVDIYNTDSRCSDEYAPKIFTFKLALIKTFNQNHVTILASYSRCSVSEQ